MSKEGQKYIVKDLVSEKRAAERGEINDVVLTVILICVCLFVLWTKLVWLEPVRVSGESMEDTLKNGDTLVLDRLAEPDYGDVIVFSWNASAGKKDGGGSILYIKRVVALGGDSVAIEGGNVYLKKKGESDYSLLTEDYAKGKTYGYTTSKKKTERKVTFFVPEGYFFAMGDNRENSSDCRLFGALPLDCSDGVVHDFFIRHKDDNLALIYKFL